MQTKNKEFKNIIYDLKEQVEKGNTFHVALKKYKHVFSELFVNLVEAGEVSGKLEETLLHLLIQMKKSYALNKKIRNALMYPMIIVIAMIGLGIGMVIFVLPNLINLYAESDFVLPLPTRITLGVSEFLIGNGWIVGSVLLVLVGGFFLGISREQGKYYWHLILLKIPIISGIIKKINLAKLTRVLNSLIVTDIPIVDVFKIISKTLGNRIYRNYLLSVTNNLKSGETIYKIFNQRPELFPPIVSQMINIGEQSGTIDDITKKLAEFYEQEVADNMANLTVIVEPLVMLLVGAGVAFMAVSVIYPIYALVNQI